MKTPLLSCLFLLRICFVSLTFHTFVVSSQCPGDQQSLLLQLKNTLTFDPPSSKKLVNWNNGSDYCSWEGVSCKEGCVSNLDLSSEAISGGLDNSSSLFGLKSIENLNLAFNFFNYAQIPSEFKQLTGLSNLNLSHAGFAGQVPIEISHLTRLVTLDLSANRQLQGSLPEFPKNASLRSLVLSGTNFSGLLPNSIGNLKMLSKIDISGCNFTGSIPSSIEDLHQLVYFDLSSNKFNGSVPSLSMAKNLTLINLSYNQLTDQINSTHWENLTNLMTLYLASNQLDGTIPPSLFSLPMLQYLGLFDNHFSGQLPEFGNFSTLSFLDLSNNSLEGPIPMSIFNLRELEYLILSSNNFSGSFPLNDIQQLKNLSYLDLSYNSLLINYDSSNSSYSFPQLFTLKLAAGKLRTFPDFLRNQSILEVLDLSLNQIHGETPNWIWKLSSLNRLNLSCNSLVNLPGPFLNLTSNLYELDLHSNQLQGPIPMLPPSASYLDYSRNNFSSSIPADIGDFLTETYFFSLASNHIHGIIPESVCKASLPVLDLSNNSLSGMIPQCLTARSRSLGVLNLRRNKLSGTLPDNFPEHCRLQTLDLNGNVIGGQFPKSLANCTMLEVLNLGNNQITDVFPCSLKNISSLRVLVLRFNKFYDRIECFKTNSAWPKLQIIDIARNNFTGEIPGSFLKTWQAMMGDDDGAVSKSNQDSVYHQDIFYYHDTVTVTAKGREMELVKILTIFTSIDISCNNFNGSIPEEVGKLKSLYGLNLSSNALTGAIPSSLGNLRQLESLDLSDNKLSGTIPSELSKLNFLSFLDLSSNQLVGKIPTGTQIQSFSADSFAGNKGLYGPPLHDGSPTLEGKHSNSAHGIDWDLISAEIGFVCGFGVAVGSLGLCKRWSKWYYKTMYKILVKIFPQLEDRIGPHRRHVHINQRFGR